MKKEKEKLFNYILTIIFILFIFIFLIVIVQISRYVFSDITPLQEHVVKTKDLLNKINEVEASVEEQFEINKNNQEQADKTNKPINTTSVNFVSFQENIKDITYLNMNEKKGIISIVFNNSINIFNNIYYLNINSINQIKENDKILYKNNYQTQIATINTKKNNIIEITDIQTNEEKRITINDIVGKIILKFEAK